MKKMSMNMTQALYTARYDKAAYDEQIKEITTVTATQEFVFQLNNLMANSNSI